MLPILCEIIEHPEAKNAENPKHHAMLTFQ